MVMDTSASDLEGKEEGRGMGEGGWRKGMGKWERGSRKGERG